MQPNWNFTEYFVLRVVATVLKSRMAIRGAMMVLLALLVLLHAELRAQSTDVDTTGRADQIQMQRLEKARDLHGTESTAIAKTFSAIGHVGRRIPIGIGVAGLGPGAGLTIGSNLQWNSDNKRLLARLWGTGTVHDFYNVGTGIEITNILSRDLSGAFEGSHADAPQLEYYGPGPKSSIHDRTDFRREDTFFNVRVQFRKQGIFQPACAFGQLLLNVGPGTNGSLPTTESIFDSQGAPGIQVQSNFLLAGCSAKLDTRDVPQDPRTGTYAEARYYRYHAQGHPEFSFDRLSVFGQQNVSFFNQKRVIELRGTTELSFHSENQVVPFYLQPTLGSDTDLRGFRRYRFYDENLIALSTEYRWEVNTAFDMAIFVDGGKVFHRSGQISLYNLETSPGFGFRFKNPVVARLDAGFSREGVQVWLKLSKLF